jgi:hypothetical protein
MKRLTARSPLSPQTSPIRLFAGSLPLLAALVTAPAHAEVPATCLALYIEAGAIPVGPNASFGRMLVCKNKAASAKTNLGNY